MRTRRANLRKRLLRAGMPLPTMVMNGGDTYALHSLNSEQSLRKQCTTKEGSKRYCIEDIVTYKKIYLASELRYSFPRAPPSSMSDLTPTAMSETS